MDPSLTDTTPAADSPLSSVLLLRSWEIRWFLPGAPPDTVVRAFRTLEPWTQAAPRPEATWSPSRTDRYLAFADDMGIKTRQDPGSEARLEFKGRLEDHGTVELGSGVAGRADEWVKWSYPAASVPERLLEAVLRGPDSVPVTKERILRTVRLDPGAEAREVAVGAGIPRGVQVELARIRMGQGPERSWSLSLEAFPPDPTLHDDVRVAMAPFLEALRRAGNLALTGATSRSYPAWLAERDRDTGPS